MNMFLHLWKIGFLFLIFKKMYFILFMYSIHELIILNDI